jgi:cellulose synthase/poly-beta-1,6-N-acetylglucosamine synthase-like glycosyltransferase
VVDEKTPLSQEAVSIGQPVRKNGERYRALNPWSAQDAPLLEIVHRGEFAMNGFRNRDWRALLHPKKGTEEEEKRRAAWITRQLRWLRGHGLIPKVSGTHRYVLSPKGRKIITALMTARQADVAALTKLAA